MKLQKTKHVAATVRNYFRTSPMVAVLTESVRNIYEYRQQSKTNKENQIGCPEPEQKIQRVKFTKKCREFLGSVYKRTKISFLIPEVAAYTMIHEYLGVKSTDEKINLIKRNIYGCINWADYLHTAL